MAWDRRTGAPVHNAVVWMSKQTDDIVRRWQAAGLDPEVRARTGLNNDSYFTAPKLAWYWRTSTASPRGPAAASSPPAPSTPGCCGTSPAAART